MLELSPDHSDWIIFDKNTSGCGIKPIPKPILISGGKKFDKYEKYENDEPNVSDLLFRENLTIPIYGTNSYFNNIVDSDSDSDNDFDMQSGGQSQGGEEGEQNEIIQDDLYDKLLALVDASDKVPTKSNNPKIKNIKTKKRIVQNKHKTTKSNKQ